MSVGSAFDPRYLSFLIREKGTHRQREAGKKCQNCIRVTETHFLKCMTATHFSKGWRVAGIVFSCSEFIGHRDRRCMRIKACRPELQSNRLRNSSFWLRRRFLRTSRSQTRRRRKLRLCAWSSLISFGFLCSDLECLTNDGSPISFEMICK